MTSPSQPPIDEVPPPHVDPGAPVFRALDLLLRSIVAALAFPGDIPNLLIVERLAAAGASVRRALQVVQPAAYVEGVEADDCGSIHCIESLAKEAAVEVYSMAGEPWSVGDVADVERHWKLATRELSQVVDLWGMRLRSEERGQHRRDFGLDSIVQSLQPHFPMLLDMCTEYVQGPKRTALSIGKEMAESLDVLRSLDAELRVWSKGDASACSGEDVATIIARVSEASIALVQHINTLGAPQPTHDVVSLLRGLMGAGSEHVPEDLAAFEAALARVADKVAQYGTSWKETIVSVFPAPYSGMLRAFATNFDASASFEDAAVWDMAAVELASSLLALQQMDGLGPFQPLDVVNAEGE